MKLSRIFSFLKKKKPQSNSTLVVRKVVADILTLDDRVIFEGITLREADCIMANRKDVKIKTYSKEV